MWTLFSYIRTERKAKYDSQWGQSALRIKNVWKKHNQFEKKTHRPTVSAKVNISDVNCLI